MSESWLPPARVLCLDGGGVRGLSALMILRQVMNKIADVERAEVNSIRPCDYFDFICGTSTGGLIAIMLGRLQFTVQEAIEAYVTLAQDIFKDDRSRSILGSSLRASKHGQARFDAKILEEKVKDLVASRCNGNRDERMFHLETATRVPGSRPCHVAVVAVFADRINNPQPHLLTTYDRNELCTIWQAARATSAAPTFFDPIEIGVPPVRYIDAGLGYNNPAEVAFDAVGQRWKGRRFGVFLSLGTGKESEIALSRKTSLFGLRNQVEIVSALKELATSANRTHEQMWKRFTDSRSNGPQMYFRFNVDGVGQIGLQEWQKESELAGLTQAYLNGAQINHEKDLCAQRVRQLSRRSSPFELSAKNFRANGEEHIDNDYPAMRYWYREEVAASGYPLAVTVDQEHRQKTAKPVGQAILSLRRMAMLLVRAQAFDITPGKYNVRWILWFWAGKDAKKSHEQYSQTFPTKVRSENSIYERSFQPPAEDSGFFHCGGLKLSVGRAKDPSAFPSLDFNPDDHPDYAEHLLTPGYTQRLIDWGAWNTMRNTGWSEMESTAVEVQDDGHLAFTVAMDWERGHPRWLGGFSFGGVRLEPVLE